MKNAMVVTIALALSPTVGAVDFVDDNSLMKVFEGYLGTNDQHYQPRVVTGGVPTPLNLDFDDPDHPQPNWVGGDSETFDGTMYTALYLESTGLVSRVEYPIAT